ncbi:hypothetical protein [Ammoniphilus sp. YIM 78166]|uniref:hypothetical protein n=1 Tax=Ammoniphilus sp. YIM 78166 TaxID=1644106 RepID=UPI001431D40E|nr:hypothetical protein [Ammoniphilus sp. YIM 78166]
MSFIHLDQKVIESLLLQVYERSQKDSDLHSQEVIQDMVEQLKIAMNPVRL